MNFERTLLTAYANTTRHTLQCWKEQPTVGQTRPAPYHKSYLGIATGNVIHIADWLSELHEELTMYAQHDARLDVVPRDSVHFTFLALATTAFESIDDVPKEVEHLIPLYETHVRSMTFCVRRVSLLPLQNALLMAGIPTAESFEARRAFAKAVLSSAWEPWLRDRYSSIPPLFWHTTLARYDAECLPDAIRRMYQRYSTKTLPAIEVGSPLLAATTYNWSRVIQLFHT
jgi:hypothetical protein